MKISCLNICAGIALIFVASSSFGIGDSGHGGGAFICPNPSESELLDLRVARLKGLEIPDNQSVADAFKRLNEINPFFASRVQKIFSNFKIINSPVPPPIDAHQNIEKPNCPFGGIGRYDVDDDILYRDDTRLSTFPVTDRSAFDLHEAISKLIYDEEKVLDTKKAQLINGYLFSTKFIGSVTDGLPPNSLFCNGMNGSKFYLSLGQNDAEIYVVQFLGMPVFGKTIARTQLIFQDYLEFTRFESPMIFSYETQTPDVHNNLGVRLSIMKWKDKPLGGVIQMKGISAIAIETTRKTDKWPGTESVDYAECK